MLKMKIFVFSLILMFCSSSYSQYNLNYYSGDVGANSQSNFYMRQCTYDKQCDEQTGYVCRNGICTCKFGRPDPSDGFKCKVQVKLGDFCKELRRSKTDRRRFSVYVRRKCPHNSECGEDSGICECGPLFERKGSNCTPKILNAGGKNCRDHLECIVQRGQQCYNGSCVECAIGRFKNFRPTTKWVEANPECTCFDKLAELQENMISPVRHKRGMKGSCTPPISLGDHCTINRNCKSASTPQLICDGGLCSCPPGSREFRSQSSYPLSTFCIVSINSPCTGDRDCHGPTAYCETRLEVPICKCRDGFELQGVNKGTNEQFSCASRFHEEVCGKFTLSDSFREQLKDQKLSCIQGIYECARPREMFWHEDRGKCVSLVGGRCDLDLFDLSGCAGVSRCWEYKGLGEYRCRCPLQDEDEDNKISDTNVREEQGFNKFGANRMVRFKPTRDRRTCTRSE